MLGPLPCPHLHRAPRRHSDVKCRTNLHTGLEIETIGFEKDFLKEREGRRRDLCKTGNYNVKLSLKICNIGPFFQQQVNKFSKFSSFVSLAFGGNSSKLLADRGLWTVHMYYTSMYVCMHCLSRKHELHIRRLGTLQIGLTSFVPSDVFQC